MSSPRPNMSVLSPVRSSVSGTRSHMSNDLPILTRPHTDTPVDTRYVSLDPSSRLVETVYTPSVSDRGHMTQRNTYTPTVSGIKRLKALDMSLPMLDLSSKVSTRRSFNQSMASLLPSFVSSRPASPRFDRPTHMDLLNLEHHQDSTQTHDIPFGHKEMDIVIPPYSRPSDFPLWLEANFEVII